MNNALYNFATARRLLGALLVAQLALTTPLHAASVALATAPLANSTTTTVLPNLMFVMDNSGSMGQDYTPDWIMEYNMRNAPWTDNDDWLTPNSRQKNCRDSADDDGLIVTAMSTMDMCVVGDVPFMTSAINVQYYNPEIRYLPGVNADGSSKPSQTDPTAVLLDGYDKHNQTQLGVAGTTIDLTTQYPDRVWCTTQTPTAAQLIDTTVCRKNSDYLYPNATFKYGRDNNATIANRDVLGVSGAPYYYLPVVSEYCSEAQLRNCVASATPTGVYTFPATARWCNSPALNQCQSIKTSSYIYPRYPGTVGEPANGRFRTPNGTNTFTAINVGAVNILGASITGTSRTDSATKLAAQINTFVSSPDYIAAVCPDDNQYVCVTGTAVGTASNGAITSTGAIISNMTDMAGGFTASPAVPAYSFTRVNIVSSTPSYPKTTARTDCAGATCTYTEEITNFGNWYAYYRTRMQAMKSAVSLAFKPIGSNYRIGFINICKGDYLPVSAFDNVALSAGDSTGSRVNTATIDSVTVNGVEVLGASVTGTDRNDLAAKVAAQITSFASSPDYVAEVFSSRSVRIIAADFGSASNGTLAISGAASWDSVNNLTGGANNTTGQKDYWYGKLFNTTASGCGTPLREALATVGRIYAGKELSSAGSVSGLNIDPMQYSCQQNFTLMTTDGYWNGAGGTDVKGNAMGNLDSDSALRSLGIYEGPTASSGTLADVSKYYYDTDVRNNAASPNDFNNCTGSLGIDVCTNNVPVSSTDKNTQQHMTTYTLGLGVDGTLSFVSDYKTATSGDYYDLTHGLNSVNWPDPTNDNETAVDDLWHAAANGRGTYFSAKNPAELGTGLSAALAAIGSQIGAASAAATSTLNPVAGNNFAYVASYSTVKWQGNLEARSIDVVTGVVNQSASWCVESIPGGSCSAPSSVVADNSTASTVYYCVTPSSTLAACPAPAVFDSASNECSVQLPVACTGTMPGMVGSASDTRTIYKSNGAGALQDFVIANLNAADFAATGLSQWSTFTATQKTTAAGTNLVNFLRGQTGFEQRTSNTVTDRLFRYREATLGDPLESQPFFISAPIFSYADPGYTAYKTTQASRPGTVYMGVNDGMMHAFAADTGIERWAYVPSVVIPNMWKLADQNYSTAHTNYVNGSPVISDICTANCTVAASAVWKTILVGGLNAGGRSFYALDITDPLTPTLLWEISSATSGFSNLGYSYGPPVITKKADGTWVVVVTSGYNNTSPGNGHGTLYVLNAASGAKISEYDTGVGSTTTPSGLAKVAAWNDFGGTNNTAGYFYGGDLLGNLWRFDINSAASPVLFATLKDALGNAQPVTTTPTLGQIKGQRIVFVGTGKYLEVSDLTDTARQTVYAIRDDNTATTLVNARTALVAQTLTVAGATRTGSNNAVDFTSGRGWYIDLVDSAAPTFNGERVNIDMQLIQGTLIFASIIPSSTVCSPGGSGWLNFVNYETGGYVGPLTLVSTQYNSPIVGINVLYILGKPKIEVVTATNPTPQIDPNVQIKASGSAFTGKRVIWRELLP
ncbi:MAG: hypothetical protein IPI21_04325 [Propionivibrio sp.]|nr:hypothetical protein [Propionivibrio sp.]